MNSNRRALAATELLLIFPAALFMFALLMRQVQPLSYEPAHTAQQIITWYAGRVWTLWVLLFALPLAVLVIGCVALLRGWRNGLEPRRMLVAIRADPTMLLIVATTVVAGVILVIVGLHVLMN